jgi:aminoglycoside phosphotransferase (APT) family kinase protein
VHRWAAELQADEGLVRRLVDEQFPELASAPLERLAEGWDNVVWLVDDTWVFRFPRRSIAVGGLERELELLPRLAPLLPVAVPVPVFRGRATDFYPWPFYGAAHLPGTEAGDAQLTDQARVGLAAQLGAFLRQLHSEAAAEAARDVELPVDPLGRADMERRVPATLEFLAQVRELGIWHAPKLVEHVLASARRLPAPAGRPVVVHGDLYFRHLLVDATGRLTAVIDWGDICLADPSVDLHVLWSFLPREAREEFLHAYGHVSDERLLRARVFALSLCAVLATYGRHESLPRVEREAVASLERATTD